MQLWDVNRIGGRCLAVVGVASLSLILVSCGSKDPKSGARHPVFPVHGKVFINGEPAVGVQVMLIPDQPLKQLSQTRGKLVHMAEVDTNGDFQINTYSEGDGAPAASYKVRLRLMRVASATFSKNVDMIDVLEGAYDDIEKNAENDPEHFTVTVTEQGGATIIPRIDLDIDGF